MLAPKVRFSTTKLHIHSDFCVLGRRNETTSHSPVRHFPVPAGTHNLGESEAVGQARAGKSLRLNFWGCDGLREAGAEGTELITLLMAMELHQGCS